MSGWRPQFGVLTSLLGEGGQRCWVTQGRPVMQARPLLTAQVLFCRRMHVVHNLASEQPAQATNPAPFNQRQCGSNLETDHANSH